MTAFGWHSEVRAFDESAATCSGNSLRQPPHSRTGRRQDLQSVFLPDLNHARDFLLLGCQRADFFEEPFEARRRDSSQEPAGRLADVAVMVRQPTRREDRRALWGREGLPVASEFIFTFEDLERLVLPMMNVGWRTSARLVGRFDNAQHAASVAAVDSDGDGIADDIYRLASAVENKDGVHKWIGIWFVQARTLSLCAYVSGPIGTLNRSRGRDTTAVCSEQ